MTQTASPIRVLIIEDVEAMRELLAEILGNTAGIAACDTAANTWEARRRLLHHRPDLVLLDEVLPGESSLGLLSELAAEGLPVLLMTGMEFRSESLPEGVLGRIRKPGWKHFEKDSARLSAEVLDAAGRAHQA